MFKTGSINLCIYIEAFEILHSVIEIEISSKRYVRKYFNEDSIKLFNTEYTYVVLIYMEQNHIAIFF